MKQTEVATMLHVSRPKVSDVVKKMVSKFTINVLVNMLTRIKETCSDYGGLRPTHKVIREIQNKRRLEWVPLGISKFYSLVL